MRRQASGAQQRHRMPGWVAQQADKFVADAHFAHPGVDQAVSLEFVSVGCRTAHYLLLLALMGRQKKPRKTH